MYNFKKLKLKIKEVYDTQEKFAKDMGMGETSLNQRLNNSVEWKVPEMFKACKLLSIDISEADLYFYVEETQKTE